VLSDLLDVAGEVVGAGVEAANKANDDAIKALGDGLVATGEELNKSGAQGPTVNLMGWFFALLVLLV
jgi:hypothetical protein